MGPIAEPSAAAPRHRIGRVIVLLNVDAGRTSQHEPCEMALRRALEDAGVEATVRRPPARQLHAAASQAAREQVDAVIAAGGDGTVSAVAGALMNTHIPLGVLPIGTFNHFARDVGVPLALPQAARVIAEGRIRRIDIAEVNGRCFVNNSSIGIYPHIVVGRDSQRQRLGRGKWVAMALAVIAVFRRYPMIRISLQTDSASLSRKTPFAFIGNNRYEMSLMSLGLRRRLDAGELSVYVANHPTRFGLLWMMFRALFNRLQQSKDFDTMSVNELRIEAHKKMLRVACDGEVLRLRPPLQYRIHPGALAILA